MHTRCVSWARYALLGAVVLALVLVIPVSWFPFQLSKIAAFAALLSLAAVLFVVGGGTRLLMRTHGFFAALLVLALPVVYTLSAAVMADRSLAFAGYSIETDTILFSLLATLAYLLSFTLFRTLRTARLLTTVVFWSLAAAAIFQLISVTIGSYAIPLETFTDRSVNLIGKWNDLGLLAALLLLLLLVRVELGTTRKLFRIGAWIGGGLLAALLALINFPVAWMLLLVGCVVVGLLSLLRQRADHRTEPDSAMRARLPHYALAAAAVAIVSLLYGGTINTSLTKIFPVSALEVRPSLQATMDIVNEARAGSVKKILIGTGPSSFGFEWLQYKPQEVNQTQFWNLDFTVGFSTLATAFGTVGLLGAIAWLLPLLLLAAAMVRTVRLAALSREERAVGALLSLGSIFLFASIVLYVPSQNLVLLSYMLSGAAFGFLWRQGRTAQEEEEIPGIMKGLGIIAVTAVCLVLVAASFVSVERRFVSQAYTAAGLYALGQGDIDTAMVRAARAVAIEPGSDALRLMADSSAQKLLAIANDSTLTQEQATADFTTQLQTAIPASQRAIAAVPGDYRSYFLIARVYDFLASLKVSGAYESAQQAYAEAVAHNPTNPALWLALARLEAGHGDNKATEAALKKALELKPDYTDAMLFVVQINVANNDLASAIKNTTTAVQTAPGVPSIWFQLGLLYYTGGDTKNAIPPLEQALTLESSYANAKYFLGLSYAAEGKTGEALRLFEDLVVTNPDNAEIKKIVANLKAGTNPLEGIGPPTPQNRTTAPVNQ